MGPCVVDRVLKSFAVAGIAERHQNNGGAVVGGPRDTLNNVAILTETLRSQNFHRHYLNFVVTHPGDTLLIVGAGGHDPGESGTVAVFIGEWSGAIKNGIARNDDACEI